METCRKSQYQSGNMQKIPILWWKHAEYLNIIVQTCRKSQIIVETYRKAQYYDGNKAKISILWWKHAENLNIKVGTCRQSKYHSGNLQNISIVL